MLKALIEGQVQCLRNFALLFSACALGACATYEYHETSNVSLNKVAPEQAETIDEATLLDIGIVLFDPGVDITDDVSLAYANVRESEAVWFTGLLKTTLDKSRAWGAVRALPNNNSVSDLMIEGTIVESSGEMLILELTARDASGTVWFANEYSERASAYSYNPEVDLQRDPFQSLFSRVANDLFDFRTSLGNSDLANIRDIARLRFANEFSPESFGEFLQQQDDGSYQLTRIPADNDPMLLRVENIKARNELFLDVIQDYYRGFTKNMASPYDEWRKLSYKDVLYERQLRKKARQEKFAGVGVMVAGILTAGGRNSGVERIGGHVGTLYGARLFRKGFITQAQANTHAEAVRELGQSLEAELEPSVIDLQDRSVTLSGTVEDQFKEWRRILVDMFEAEQGSLPPTDTTSLDSSLFNQDSDPFSNNPASPE